MKSSTDEILRFIASSFRSVWALELLLVLKGTPRPWSREELVTTMRASDLVVTKGLDALEVAGLVTNSEEKAQYMPVSKDVAALVDEAEALYAKRPDAAGPSRGRGRSSPPPQATRLPSRMPSN